MLIRRIRNRAALGALPADDLSRRFRAAACPGRGNENFLGIGVGTGVCGLVNGSSLLWTVYN
jgi:hypothetical protein